MFLCSCLQVPAPTPKSAILTKIQKGAFVVTVMYALLVFWSEPTLGFAYLLSSLLLLNAYRQISYFSCVMHQLFCWGMCAHVVLKVSG